MGHIFGFRDMCVNKDVCRSTEQVTRVRKKPSYGCPMPRTDENGRQLKALLDFLLDGDVDSRAIYDALGISSSTYYRRLKEADHPSAYELRIVADRFGLSYPDLQVRFGLMSREELTTYVESAPVRVMTVTEPPTPARALRRSTLSDLTPRQDAPPL